MYDCVTGCGVDPRNIASRIMDIRSQLAAEFVQDLRNVAEARAAHTISSVHSDLSGRPVSGGPLELWSLVRLEYTIKCEPSSVMTGPAPRDLAHVCWCAGKRDADARVCAVLLLARQRR